jgi:hypothetical protein
VDQAAISVDGRPALSVINFGKNISPDDVERLLDRVAS